MFSFTNTWIEDFVLTDDFLGNIGKIYSCTCVSWLRQNDDKLQFKREYILIDQHMKNVQRSKNLIKRTFLLIRVIKNITSALSKNNLDYCFQKG